MDLKSTVMVTQRVCSPTATVTWDLCSLLTIFALLAARFACISFYFRITLETLNGGKRENYSEQELTQAPCPKVNGTIQVLSYSQILRGSGARRMIMSSLKCLFFALLGMVTVSMATGEIKTCFTKKSPCFLQKIECPAECPSTAPNDPEAKVCYVECNSPICKAECKSHKPNCNGPGAMCLDPKFTGGDGIVFYFHGKRNEHFSLVSDVKFQINARFIGLRPAGRARDYTWIQALGFLFDSKTFTLDATHVAKWDDGVDHLNFTYNEDEIIVPGGHLSRWESPDSELLVERISDVNSVLITLSDYAEISVRVVPVTEEDDRIHNYQIPEDNCFAHLEVQFKFYALSSNVEGVLGRTYQPDFKYPAKPRVAMPLVGGTNKYRTASLLSAECSSCTYSPAEERYRKDFYAIVDHGMVDCADEGSKGDGLFCRK